LLDSSGKEKKKIIDTDLCHQDNWFLYQIISFYKGGSIYVYIYI
jgi:hypothetical protein